MKNNIMKISNLKIGNLVYFEQENGEKKPVTITTLERTERMNPESCKEIAKFSGLTYANSEQVKLLSGIPVELFLNKLPEEYHSKKYENHYALWTDIDKTYYLHKLNGFTEPTYAIGVDFWDSTYDYDKNVIHEFMWNIKYVHELQNIMSSITSGESDTWEEWNNILHEISFE